MMEIFIGLLLLVSTAYGFTHYEFNKIESEMQRICGSDKWTHLNLMKDYSDEHFIQQASGQCAIALSNLPEKHLSKKVIGFLTKAKVKLLQISDGLNSVENNVLNDLYNLKYLGLSKNNLNTSKVVESDGSLFSKLEWLDLSINNLHHLDFLKTTAKNMTKINLNDNEFEVFPLKPLRNLKNLKEITIKRNRMQRFPAVDFKFYSVQYLDASNNWLSDLYGLENFPDLKYLDLTRNKIKELSGEYFSSEQYQLEELILDENPMEVLHTEKLLNLTHLKKLSLERNELKLIRPYYGLKLKYDFLLITRMEFLNLGKNYLTDIPSSFFRCFPTLKTLKLNNNKFNQLTQGMFANLNQLEKLDLSNNQITNFDKRRFSSLESLLELNIENNKIKTIDYAFLVLHVPTLRNISISKNPLQCDNLREMLPFFNSSDIHVTKKHTRDECFPAEHIEGVCCTDTNDARNTSDILEEKLNIILSLVMSRNRSNQNFAPKVITAQEQIISSGYITKFHFWTGVILVIVALCILLSVQTYFLRRKTNHYTTVAV